MKNWLRKALVSVSAAVVCSVQAVSSIPYYGSATSNQLYTWRMVEQGNVKGMLGYTSTTKNTKNYIYGGCTKRINSGSFMSDYTDNTLGCIWFSVNSYTTPNAPGTKDEEKELSRSTWYAPSGTTYFSLEHKIDDLAFEPEGKGDIKSIGVLVGDVNNDKKITSADTQIIAQCLLPNSDKVNMLTYEQRIAADVNNNYKIDLQDAIAIETFLDGNIDRFPSGE